MKKLGIRPLSFSRPLHGLQILQLLFPAVNCWATIIRPLCGLRNLLFGQSPPEERHVPFSKAECFAPSELKTSLGSQFYKHLIPPGPQKLKQSKIKQTHSLREP